MKTKNPASNSGPSMEALLLSIAASHDRVAFAAVFEHFAPRLKSFAMRQGSDPQLAEEVAQETLVNVWRKAGHFDPAKASASTWVFTIARNKRIDLLRRTNRPEPDMDDPALVPDPEPEAFDVVAREQQSAQLHDAMATLPEEQKTVLRLAFFEDLAHPEIAEKLDLPLGTVKSRIRLAMKRVRAELGDTL